MKKSLITKAIVTTATLSLGYGALVFDHTQFSKNSKPDAYAGFRLSQSPATGLSESLKRLSQAFSVKPALATEESTAMAPLAYLRAGVGFAIGYGEQGYTDYVCGGTAPAPGANCDGPPKIGLVGTFLNIANNMDAVAKAAGYATCDSIPSSGTATGKVDSADATLTFGVPTERIPAGYAGAGLAYDKKMSIQVAIANESPTTMSLEFSCTTNSATIYTTMVVGSHAPTFNRLIQGHFGDADGGDSKKHLAEVFVSEYSSSLNRVRGAYTVKVAIDENTKTYRLWPVVTGQLDNKTLVTRGAVRGNYETGITSIFYQDFAFNQISDSSNSLDLSGINSLPNATSDSISEQTEYDFTTIRSTSTTTIARQGCAVISSAGATAPTSAAKCEGLPLDEEAGAPSIDATGKYSTYWLLTTMHSKIKSE